MNLTMALPPQAPSKPQHLRAFALGPMLHAWSEDFQPKLLETAQSALENVQSLILSGTNAIADLAVIRGTGILSLEEERAEETRITIQIERCVAMLDRLGAFHQRTTSVSAAALLHAMTRGNLTDSVERQERNASPRRRLASASDLVIES